MAAEMLEQFDLAQSPLGEDLLAEHIGDLFNGHALASLDVGRGTAKEMSSDHEGPSNRRPSLKQTYHTIPYAPWPSSLVTL